MTKSVVVRYRTTPEAADENARLVQAVYAALAQVAPVEFRYRTYRLGDGTTFVHVAEQDAEVNPLSELPEFAEFQRELSSRVVEPPAPSEGSIVGSYGWQD
jgi:hypothetical protein